MSLLRQFAGQTVIYGIGHILSRALYFLLLIFYLSNRFEDSYEYGLYGLMYGYATLLIVLMSYRIDTAFFRFGSKDGSLKSTFSSAFFPLIITTTILVLLIIAFSSQISGVLNLAQYPHYFRWFAIIIGLDVLSLLPFGKLRLENRAKTFMLLRIGNILLTMILLIFFLEFYLPANPDGGFLKQIFTSLSLDVDYVFIANIVSSFVLFISLLFTLGKLTWKVDWQLWKKMVLYAFPLIIVGIANSVNQYFSPQLQQAFLSGGNDQNIAEGGVYSLALRIASLLVIFNSAFNYAAEPFFFKNAANRNDKAIYAKVLNLYTLFAVLMIVGLMYYIDVMKIFLPPEYFGGLFTIPILLFAFLMLGIYYNVSIWYKLADKNIYGGLISSAGVIITLSLSFILLPQIGIVASAWSSLACYTGMVLLALYFGGKHYPIDYDIRKLLGLILMAIAMVVFALIIEKLNLTLPISLLIKTLLFIAFTILLYRQHRSLLKELKSQ